MYNYFNIPNRYRVWYTSLYDPRVAILSRIDAEEISTVKLFYTQRIKRELVERYVFISMQKQITTTIITAIWINQSIGERAKAL